MTRTVLLDAGPLGLLTNPKRTPEAVAITQWSISMMRAGHRLIVPAISDYEVRRELLRAGKTRGLQHLDAFCAARPGRYLPLADAVLKEAARLWAAARGTGTPTADPHELDCDIILAAQALSLSVRAPDIVVATTNVGHLVQFVPASLWTAITP